MWIPAALYTAARRSSGIAVFCPYGHSLHYPEGENEETTLRRERDQLRQRIAQRDDEIRHQKERAETAERSAVAYKGQVTKIKRRTLAGVCPCCTRTFQNLARHVATKHPGYAKHIDADDVVGKSEERVV
jgi:hypothetical protein